MHRTSGTQTSDDVGHNLSEIVDHLTRARGFGWPISLTVIDQQGQTLWLIVKTDWAGITVHYLPGIGGVHMSLYSPVPLVFFDGNGRPSWRR